MTDPATETLVRVAAVEAPSYAGHGPLAGVPVHLLRLGMCNLSCDWCSAPETVAALGALLDTTAPYTTVAALVDRLTPQLDADPEIPLIITGGEPLLQDHAILDLGGRLLSRGYTPSLWVETNGTIAAPTWWDDANAAWPGACTIVSPKIATRDPVHRRLPDRALTTWATLQLAGRPVFFDFTVATRSDVVLAATLCNQYGLTPRHCTLTARTREDSFVAQQASLAAILDTALAYGFTTAVRPLTDHRSIEVHRRG